MEKNKKQRGKSEINLPVYFFPQKIIDSSIIKKKSDILLDSSDENFRKTARFFEPSTGYIENSISKDQKSYVFCKNPEETSVNLNYSKLCSKQKNEDLEEDDLINNMENYRTKSKLGMIIHNNKGLKQIKKENSVNKGNMLNFEIRSEFQKNKLFHNDLLTKNKFIIKKNMKIAPMGEHLFSTRENCDFINKSYPYTHKKMKSSINDLITFYKVTNNKVFQIYEKYEDNSIKLRTKDTLTKPMQRFSTFDHKDNDQEKLESENPTRTHNICGKEQMKLVNKLFDLKETQIQHKKQTNKTTNEY